VSEVRPSPLPLSPLAQGEGNAFFNSCPICGGKDRSTVAEFTELRFSKCGSCGLVYKSEQAQGLARKYDAAYFEKGGSQYLKRWDHRVAKCRRQLLMCLEFAPHASSMLDVGCSAGYVLAAAESLKLRATGVDYASWAAGFAHERGFKTAAASLTELPFRDSSFDLVTAKHTLEHVLAPKTAMAELHRVLKPGGVAMIVVPDVAYRRNVAHYQPDRLGWQHHVYYDVPTLSRGLEEAGFEICSSDKAMLRRRLAKGLSAPYEWLRFGALKAWTAVSRTTRLRRELQLIARKRQ
jgi:SAM-dependent methyltransferase